MSNTYHPRVRHDCGTAKREIVPVVGAEVSALEAHMRDAAAERAVVKDATAKRHAALQHLRQAAQGTGDAADLAKSVLVLLGA